MNAAAHGNYAAGGKLAGVGFVKFEVVDAKNR
jgi:hypothetical protein